MRRDHDEILDDLDPFLTQAASGEDPSVPFAEMAVSNSSTPATDAKLQEVEREHRRRFSGRGRRILPRAAAGTIGLLIFSGAGFAAWRRLRRSRRPRRFWRR